VGEIARALQALPPALSAAVDDALRTDARPDDVVSRVIKNGVTLRRADARTLAKKAWINDEIINYYGALLQERSNAGHGLRAHVFTSFFWLRLVSAYELGTDTHERVRRSLPPASIFSFDALVVPINIQETHWYLGVIYPQRRVIAIPDSFLPSDATDRAFALLLRLVSEEHMIRMGEPLRTEAWTRDTTTWTLQRNGCDCGAFTLLNADCLLLNQPATFSPADATAFRRYVLASCIEGALV
jgi:sentrin-specific protease 1